ncbi:cytochrome P450 family protein [Saccharopolyspora thermophila]|uniref:cytochrome P450 family protein n=1 Tax=Saccharopolyspora thermophila TaxID=89367 RepID=UPI00166AF737|nr:cytochrome P450 [Saccharopolyspora subtropica]
MTQVDFASQEFLTNPYPSYARLREAGPVHRVQGPMGVEIWLVTRYEEARAALADDRLAKSLAHAPQWMRDQKLVSGEDEGVAGRNMLDTDPPDHTRMRRLVAKAFTRRRIDRLRPRIEQITGELLDGMARQREVDLIAALAFPLPITVICELLGVRLEDRDDFREWTRMMLTAPLTEEGAAQRERARRIREQYLATLIAQARARVDHAIDPDDQPDLISALVVAADERDQLSERELLGMVQLLLIAGHETAVNLIGNGMLALLTHPDQLRLLRDEPDLLAGAIEELLRYDGPVERATPRFATEDVELGGVTIPKGSAVLVGLAAADRDPAHTPGAEELDITRADRGHLAFGHGIHYCLGASLARLEGQVAIGGLLRRFPELALGCAPEELRWRPGGPVGILRGLEALPVRL